MSNMPTSTTSFALSPFVDFETLALSFSDSNSLVPQDPNQVQSIAEEDRRLRLDAHRRRTFTYKGHTDVTFIVCASNALATDAERLQFSSIQLVPTTPTTTTTQDEQQQRSAVSLTVPMPSIQYNISSSINISEPITDEERTALDNRELYDRIQNRIDFCIVPSPPFGFAILGGVTLNGSYNPYVCKHDLRTDEWMCRIVPGSAGLGRVEECLALGISHVLVSRKLKHYYPKSYNKTNSTIASSNVTTTNSSSSKYSSAYYKASKTPLAFVEDEPVTCNQRDNEITVLSWVCRRCPADSFAGRTDECIPCNQADAENVIARQWCPEPGTVPVVAIVLLSMVIVVGIAIVVVSYVILWRRGHRITLSSKELASRVARGVAQGDLSRVKKLLHKHSQLSTFQLRIREIVDIFDAYNGFLPMWVFAANQPSLCQHPGVVIEPSLIQRDFMELRAIDLEKQRIAKLEEEHQKAMFEGCKSPDGIIKVQQEQSVGSDHPHQHQQNAAPFSPAIDDNHLVLPPPKQLDGGGLSGGGGGGDEDEAIRATMLTLTGGFQSTSFEHNDDGDGGGVVVAEASAESPSSQKGGGGGSKRALLDGGAPIMRGNQHQQTTGSGGTMSQSQSPASRRSGGRGGATGAPSAALRSPTALARREREIRMQKRQLPKLKSILQRLQQDPENEDEEEDDNNDINNEFDPFSQEFQNDPDVMNRTGAAGGKGEAGAGGKEARKRYRRAKRNAMLLQLAQEQNGFLWKAPVFDGELSRGRMTALYVILHGIGAATFSGARAMGGNDAMMTQQLGVFPFYQNLLRMVRSVAHETSGLVEIVLGDRILLTYNTLVKNRKHEEEALRAAYLIMNSYADMFSSIDTPVSTLLIGVATGEGRFGLVGAANGVRSAVISPCIDVAQSIAYAPFVTTTSHVTVDWAMKQAVEDKFALRIIGDYTHGANATVTRIGELAGKIAQTSKETKKASHAGGGGGKSSKKNGGGGKGGKNHFARHFTETPTVRSQQQIAGNQHHNSNNVLLHSSMSMGGGADSDLMAGSMNTSIAGRGGTQPSDDATRGGGGGGGTTNNAGGGGMGVTIEASDDNTMQNYLRNELLAAVADKDSEAIETLLPLCRVHCSKKEYRELQDTVEAGKVPQFSDRLLNQWKDDALDAARAAFEQQQQYMLLQQQQQQQLRQGEEEHHPEPLPIYATSEGHPSDTASSLPSHRAKVSTAAPSPTDPITNHLYQHQQSRGGGGGGHASTLTPHAHTTVLPLPVPFDPSGSNNGGADGAGDGMLYADGSGGISSSNNNTTGSVMVIAATAEEEEGGENYPSAGVSFVPMNPAPPSLLTTPLPSLAHPPLEDDDEEEGGRTQSSSFNSRDGKRSGGRSSSNTSSNVEGGHTLSGGGARHSSSGSGGGGGGFVGVGLTAEEETTTATHSKEEEEGDDV